MNGRKVVQALFVGVFASPGCIAWSTPPRLAASTREPHVIPTNSNEHRSSLWEGWFGNQNPTRTAKAFVGSTLVAAALLLGGNTAALASDETLLFDLSKEDSVLIEGRSPPEIQATSSDRAMALSQKMKAMNAKMYGAYWCKFCAKQKEAFGKEAFESKNVEYVECSEDGKNTQATTLCSEKKIRGFPTWEINGKLYPGERGLDEIEVLVRMAEASSPGRDKAPPMIMTSSSEEAMTLAKQLHDLNAQLFGAYWDPHSFEAKERLGADAMTKIPYVECSQEGDNSQEDLCNARGVQVVPTWSVDGKLYKGNLDFDEMQEIVVRTQVENGKPSPPAITSASTEKTLALAKQMESLDARMYGAYFCTHCKDQKEDFGKEAFAKIPYVECTQDGKDSQLSLCQEKGIKSVPTWSINGKLFVGQRSIDQLQELVTAELEEKEQSAAAARAAGIAPAPIMATSTDQALKLASSMEPLNAKVYGAHWCRFTQSQKEKFGAEAFKKIQYVECSKDGLNSATDVCREKGIEGFPTWEISGKLYPGDQQLEELEEIVKESLAI